MNDSPISKDDRIQTGEDSGTVGFIGTTVLWFLREEDGTYLSAPLDKCARIEPKEQVKA
jgi:hypothetical protein